MPSDLCVLIFITISLSAVQRDQSPICTDSNAIYHILSHHLHMYGQDLRGLGSSQFYINCLFSKSHQKTIKKMQAHLKLTMNFYLSSCNRTLKYEILRKMETSYLKFSSSPRNIDTFLDILKHLLYLPDKLKGFSYLALVFTPLNWINWETAIILVFQAAERPTVELQTPHRCK